MKNESEFVHRNQDIHSTVKKRQKTSMADFLTVPARRIFLLTEPASLEKFLMMPVPSSSACFRILREVLYTLFPNLYYRLPPFKTYLPPVESDEQLAQGLEEVRQLFRQPGMAIAIIGEESILAKATAGKRNSEEMHSIQIADRFHIGSTSKPVTSLLIHILIAEGCFDYETSLDELLPDYCILPEYRDVTIRDLLLNRGGIIPYQHYSMEKPEIVHMLNETIPRETVTPREQRRLVTQLALSTATPWSLRRKAQDSASTPE